MATCSLNSISKPPDISRYSGHGFTITNLAELPNAYHPGDEVVIWHFNFNFGLVLIEWIEHQRGLTAECLMVGRRCA